MLVVEDIRKSYGGEAVLRGLSLQQSLHTTLSILGRSGCGKSTLLRILAGLEQADGGRFLLDGEDLLEVSAERRGVVYLSQEALLFPHLSVADNIGFGLKIRGVKPAERQEAVRAMADRLGLADQLDKMPSQLSGGQKQRVSFGRALIISPRVILLDEPFSSLDAQTRADMQAFFRQLSKDFAMTALFVTHDIKEALLVGDQLALLEAGQLQVFPSRAAFLQDPRAGGQEEMAFWLRMQAESGG